MAASANRPFWRRRLLPVVVAVLGLNLLVLVAFTVPRSWRLSRVASRALSPGTRQVTRTYSWPFERMTAPTEGSCARIVSGESGRRSGSATKPSFIWSRTAMRAS